MDTFEPAPAVPDSGADDHEPATPAVGRPFGIFFDTTRGFRRYVGRMAVISIVPSLAISMGLAASGILTEDTAPKFEGDAPIDPAILFFGLVFFSPVVETLLMPVVFWLGRRITRRPVRLAAFSAIVWAALHSSLAPVWGLGVVWPFFVFSCAYLAWRPRGWFLAFAATCCIHMCQNILPGIAVAAGANGARRPAATEMGGNLNY